MPDPSPTPARGRPSGLREQDSTIAHGIRDPVHRLAYVTRLEERLLDSRIFQRLRRMHLTPALEDLVPAHAPVNSNTRSAVFTSLAIHRLAPRRERPPGGCGVSWCAERRPGKRSRHRRGATVPHRRLPPRGALRPLGALPYGAAFEPSILFTANDADVSAPIVPREWIQEVVAAGAEFGLQHQLAYRCLEQCSDLAALLDDSGMVPLVLAGLLWPGHSAAGDLLAPLARWLDELRRLDLLLRLGLAGCDPHRALDSDALVSAARLTRCVHRGFDLLLTETALPALEVYVVDRLRLSRTMLHHPRVVLQHLVWKIICGSLLCPSSILDRLNHTGARPALPLRELPPTHSPDGRYWNDWMVWAALERIYERARRSPAEAELHHHAVLVRLLEMVLFRARRAVSLWENYSEYRQVEREVVRDAFAHEAVLRHGERSGSFLDPSEALLVLDLPSTLNFLVDELLDERGQQRFQAFLMRPESACGEDIFIVEAQCSDPLHELGMRCSERPEQFGVLGADGQCRPLEQASPRIAGLRRTLVPEQRLFAYLVILDGSDLSPTRARELVARARPRFVELLIRWAFSEHPQWDPLSGAA